MYKIALIIFLLPGGSDRDNEAFHAGYYDTYEQCDKDRKRFEALPSGAIKPICTNKQFVPE